MPISACTALAVLGGLDSRRGAESGNAAGPDWLYCPAGDALVALLAAASALG